ncbi:NADH-quinone oxidoreductase subunit L [bacterium DOLZORAL124_64_63]|nr:MAG: NADH-quinone oxidoreductase subunit L [bacterium DOLZORAL124_64_63]
MLYSALAILLLPLTSYALTFFFGKKLPRKGDFIGVTLMGVAWVLSWRIFWTFWKIGDPAYRLEKGFTWVDLGGFHIDAGILVDGMTSVMLMVVTTVSFFVHLYSTGYMHGDRRYERFFAFLGFFTFAMMGIILSNNVFFLYVFWELVGLASYLLIGFFFHKHSAANANKKAFLTNRVGDWGFWLGILTFFTATGTLNYFELFAHVHAGTIKGTLLTFAGLGLFMGCLGKSAQMPLHIWLPDAMEGPTPVSALIHAATMVAAGVYMVARLFPLFGPTTLMVVCYVGAVTAFVAATIALVKTDFKRVLAFSTLSQLGYMVMSLGAGDSVNAMFHLTTHAMFKGLLFLTAGSVIHAVHSQEITDMGGLRKKMPITFVTYMIGTLALAGVPFLSGFYSKDGILGSTLAMGMVNGHYLPFILGILAAVLTPFYMFRLTFLSFFGEPKDKERYDHAHESPWTMTVPLIVLAVFSIFVSGFHTADTGWFSKYAAPYDVPAIAAEFHLEGAAGGHELVVAGHQEGHHALDHDALHHIHHTAHVRAMIMSIIMVILGIGGSWWVYHLHKIDPAKIQARLHGVYTVLQGQYFFDEFYAATVYRFTLWWANVCAAFDRIVVDGIVNGTAYLTRGASFISGSIDKYLVDGAVNGVAAVLQGFGEVFRHVQTGRVQTYLVYVSASVLVLVLVYNVL